LASAQDRATVESTILTTLACSPDPFTGRNIPGQGVRILENPRGYEAWFPMSKKEAPAVNSSVLKNFTPYKVKKGEEYMNEQQRAHFKSILRNWKSDLMQEVDRTVTHMKDEAANFPDPADRATQEEEFSLELRTRDRERKLIKKIDATIERINQDDYGFCESCGIEIGIRRLEARPTADKCIDCKTLDEIREKQWGA
jgi:DnaK suppressor protein